MNNQFTTRDYELISAYLDNQLSAKDREQFEIRLKAEPALRKELQEIGKTRTLLRNLPKLKAPHNYFIKVEPVRAKSSLRLAPIFGVISAIASIILILVIFGSTLFSDAGPVAMAPAPQSQPTTQVLQSETERSMPKVVTPTLEAPSVMLAAPGSDTTPPSASENLASQTPPGETAAPTPTTIHIYAYLPTATPENGLTGGKERIVTTQQACEAYLRGEGYPSAVDLANCLTPTGEVSQSLQGILSSSTPTPTITASPTITVTLTPTETPTPTATPSPTETPSPSPIPTTSPTPVPSHTPEASLKLAPDFGSESATQAPSPGAAQGASNASSSVQDQSAASRNTSDVSFLSYLLLSIEISLAVIAVIAGVVAIILRIWAR